MKSQDNPEIERENNRPVVIIESSEQLEGTRKALLEMRRTYLDCFFIAHIKSMNAESYKKASIEGYDALTPLTSETVQGIYKNETLLREIEKIVTWEGIPLITVGESGEYSKMIEDKIENAMIIH